MVRMQTVLPKWALPPAIGLAALAGMFLAWSAPQDSVGWLAFLIGLMVILAVSSHTPRVATPLLIAFGIRVALALVQRYVRPLPDSAGDALWYEGVGAEVAQQGLASVLLQFRAGAFLYAWLVGLFYALTTPSPLMIQATNVLLGSLVVWNVYQAANELWGAGAALRAAWVATLFPTMGLYSAIIMREVAIVYPLTLALLFLIRWEKSEHILDLGLCLVFLTVSVGFHTGILPAFAAPVFSAALKCALYLKARCSAGALRQAAAFGLALLVTLIVVFSGWGLSKLDSDVSNASLDRLESAQEYKGRGRAAYLVGVSVHRPVDLAWQAPVRVVYFLFAPFPWMRLSRSDALALLDAMLYAGIAVVILASWRRVLWSSAARSSAVMALCLVAIFALATSNYGTAIRHRAKLAPLLIVLAPLPAVPELIGRSVATLSRIHKGG